MAIEPTSVQRDKMLSNGKTKLILVQFLVPVDKRGMKRYFLETSRAVLAEGGSRDHQLKIDQAITAGEFPYNYLTVDSFPSSQALLLTHENTREIRGGSVSEIFSLIVRPNPIIKKAAKGLGFLTPLLTKWLRTAEIKEVESIPDFSNRLDHETDPDVMKIKEFAGNNLEEPFYMMNLNQFQPTGKSNYNQYSIRIMPRLISVGGYPDIYSKVLSSYIGDQKSSLYNSWHDFALVYYPSRTSFLRLMTNTPQVAAEVRRAGLKKVVLMVCSQPSL
jgi:hypothetical protein